MSKKIRWWAHCDGFSTGPFPTQWRAWAALELADDIKERTGLTYAKGARVEPDIRDVRRAL